MRSFRATVGAALAAVLLTSSGCATPALIKAFNKSPGYEEVVTGPERRPLALTRGIRTPAGVYVVEVRYSDGQLRRVRYDPAKGKPGKGKWPRAVPKDPVRVLPVLGFSKHYPEEGATPLRVQPCGGLPKAFPCAELRGETLFICQGPGMPVAVGKLRTWRPTRRRKVELGAYGVARKVGLALCFPLAVVADGVIAGTVVGGVAGLLWLGAGAPGVCY